MDQKRALLAVVLIFLVLFGYNFWMSQKAKNLAVETVESPAVTSETLADVTDLTETEPAGRPVRRLPSPIK